MTRRHLDAAFNVLERKGQQDSLEGRVLRCFFGHPSMIDSPESPSHRPLDIARGDDRSMLFRAIDRSFQNLCETLGFIDRRRALELLPFYRQLLLIADTKREDLERCKRFNDDILYDCHGFVIRVSRSEAGKYLQRMKQAVFPSIILHLLADEAVDGDEELKIAWCMILRWIEKEIDPWHRGPQDLRDKDGWVRWALSFAPTIMDA